MDVDYGLEEDGFLASGRMTFVETNSSSVSPASQAAFCNTSTSPDDGYNIIHETWVKLLICTLYCIIVCCGIFGNGLVCYVVMRNKSMQTVTNSFIVSLAVNDIIICMLTIPLTPLYTFLEVWYFGSFMCHLFPLIQAASVFIATLTLMAIAVERFFVICFPFLPKLTTKSALFIIASIWFLSFSICIPYAIYMKYESTSPDGKGARCFEDWPNEARRTFGIVTMTVQYLIPLALISFSYTAIWLKLRQQEQKGLSNRSRRGRGDPAAIQRKQRTNRMLVAMVIIFSLCWLPLNLINILNDWFPSTISCWPYFVLFFFLAHLLAGSCSCINPILYGWMNENFKKEYKAVLPCFNIGRSDSVRTAETTTIEKNHLNNGRTKLLNISDNDSTFVAASPNVLRKHEYGALLQVDGPRVDGEPLDAV